jgi:cell division protein FtsL
MRMFKQGLKIEVCAELMRSRSLISTLKTLINKSIRLDNELFRLALEEQSYSNCPRRAYKEYYRPCT